MAAEKYRMNESSTYIPALRFDWLTPLYDPLLQWGMQEARFKRALITHAHIASGHRVLDLGCGTGTLTVLLKQTHPDANVIGLDVDPRILHIACTKARRAGVEITFTLAHAFQLPYPDNTFDRIVSSLMLHHLTTTQKQRTACEVFRVLRPGGSLHVIDFGRPHSPYGRVASTVIRAFQLEEASDNVNGLLPEMFRQAGFDPVEEPAYYTRVSIHSCNRDIWKSKAPRMQPIGSQNRSPTTQTGVIWTQPPDVRRKTEVSMIIMAAHQSPLLLQILDIPPSVLDGLPDTTPSFYGK